MQTSSLLVLDAASAEVEYSDTDLMSCWVETMEIHLLATGAAMKMSLVQ